MIKQSKVLGVNGVKRGLESLVVSSYYLNIDNAVVVDVLLSAVAGLLSNLGVSSYRYLMSFRPVYLLSKLNLFLLLFSIILSI